MRKFKKIKLPMHESCSCFTITLDKSQTEYLFVLWSDKPDLGKLIMRLTHSLKRFDHEIPQQLRTQGIATSSHRRSTTPHLHHEAKNGRQWIFKFWQPGRRRKNHGAGALRIASPQRRNESGNSQSSHHCHEGIGLYQPPGCSKTWRIVEAVISRPLHVATGGFLPPWVASCIGCPAAFLRVIFPSLKDAPTIKSVCFWFKFSGH